jgi:hypothetical protein
VRVALYDVLGREVAVATEGERAAGAHSVTLDTRSLAPGAYIVVLEAAGAHASRRLTVAR